MRKTSMRISRMSWVFLAGLGFFLLFSPSVHAAGIGLSIEPVKISQTLTPGQTSSGVITLSNASDEPVDVSASVEDFIPTAGESSIEFVGTAPGVTSVRDWVTVGGNQTFSFKQNETKQIPYTISAPADAEPGSHFGVVFFKATKQGTSTDQLKIGTRVGMLILVTIPGNHLQKGDILSFTTDKFIQGGPVRFTMRFENTGTVYYEPKGTVKITNMFGREVALVPIEGQVVLPTGVKDIYIDWENTGFLLGRYKAYAEITDSDGNVLTSTAIAFYAFPIWYILGFLVTVAIIFFVIKFLKSRVKISINLK